MTFPNSPIHSESAFRTVASHYAQGESARASAALAGMPESTARRFLRRNHLLRTETNTEAAARCYQRIVADDIQRVALIAQNRRRNLPEAVAERLCISVRTASRRIVAARAAGLIP